MSNVLFVRVSVVARPIRVSPVETGRVNIVDPALWFDCNVVVPEMLPFNIKFLPASNAKFSDDVQAPVAEYQLNVFVVSPNKDIPPLLAVESVGVATLPISIFLSSTCKVVDSI